MRGSPTCIWLECFPEPGFMLFGGVLLRVGMTQCDRGQRAEQPYAAVIHLDYIYVHDIIYSGTGSKIEIKQSGHYEGRRVLR